MEIDRIQLLCEHHRVAEISSRWNIKSPKSPVSIVRVVFITLQMAGAVIKHSVNGDVWKLSIPAPEDETWMKEIIGVFSIIFRFEWTDSPLMYDHVFAVCFVQ